jgi:hypothetical protein
MSQQPNEPTGASTYPTEPTGASAYGTEPAFGVEESTGSTTEQVKDQVRDKAQAAQDKARGAMGQARSRLSDQMDQRSTQAGERISAQAADVRSVAEELRRQGKDTPANLAERVAGQADRLGDYLKGASGDRILRDVEDLARRQPMLVAAGGLLLGFAASRFLKASSSRRYEAGRHEAGRYGDYDRTYASPYDTRTYGTGTSYESQVPYAPATTPAAGTPVVGTYDPAGYEDETPSDAYPERRS